MMNADSIQDSTRYVVGGLHRGSILPGRRAEMWRDVYLESGAHIDGGIWCGSLSVLGSNVRVAEAIYCRGPARIAVADASGDEDAINFESCFTSPDSLVIENAPSKVRFWSDIYTEQLTTSNAFVYGNIFANRAIIRDSVVLGGVFCRDSLTVERSLISTFDTGRARLGPGTLLFFPGAVARDEIILEAPVEVLTFYSLYRQQGGDSVLLDEADIIELTVPGVQDRDEPGVPERRYLLSVAERVLDSQPVIDHLAFNRKFLEHLALRSHLVPDAQEELFRDSTDELEAVLWRVVAGNPTGSGQRIGSNISDLFARLGMNSNDEATRTTDAL